MKVLIAPNSFKECADSTAVSEYLAEDLGKLGISNLVLKPVSDGGDGFLKVCEKNFSLDIINYRITSPFDNSKINCEAGYDNKNKILYIESANVLGLKIIPLVKRNPLKLSSKGMGELISKILKDHKNGKRNIEKLVIGIGGTGINDLGLGLFTKFGLKIFDNYGKELEVIPSNFTKAKKLSWSKIILPFDIEIIIDVDNDLLGKNGATYVFGKQKGLTTKGIEIVEKGFDNIINILKNNKIIESSKNLSGAGGGLAAGLQVFFGAKLIQSKQFILNELGIKKIKNIGLVITGEGAFDKQSLMDKATGSLVKYFSSKNIPVLICCGIYDKQIAKNGVIGRS
ncbi:MAG: glycerate kinase, partial [Bacteroidetes bacterium]|nr:glycerate kinase [Bacteroidota bacterium]